MIRTIEDFKKETHSLLSILARELEKDKELYGKSARGNIWGIERYKDSIFETPSGEGIFIECINGCFYFVVKERGIEFERQVGDADRTLYRLFSQITFCLASEFELNTRDWNKDSRRALFAKQVELLGCLNPSWASYQHEEHNKILIQHPFVDDANGLERFNYSKTHTPEEAYKKFPRKPQ